MLCGHGGGDFLFPALKGETGFFGSGSGNSSAVIICIGFEIRVGISYGVLIA